MKRPLVKDATMRMKDVREGDVVSRTPHDREGWFQVAVISRMFNDKIQVTDRSGELAVSGHDFDLIGIQIVTELPLPVEEVLDEGEDDDVDETDPEAAARASEATDTDEDGSASDDGAKEPAMAGAASPNSLAPPASSLAPPASLFADRRAAE